MAREIELGDAVFVSSFTYVTIEETPAQLGSTPLPQVVTAPLDDGKLIRSKAG